MFATSVNYDMREVYAHKSNGVYKTDTVSLKKKYKENEKLEFLKFVSVNKAFCWNHDNQYFQQ